MEINGLSKSARSKIRKRAKKEARKAQRPKTFYEGRGATFAFPVRNIKAAHGLATREGYPDMLGVTVWTSVKGNRPQVIEVRVLRLIIDHMNDYPDMYTADVRLKIDPTSVWIGCGAHSATLSIRSK